MVDINHWLIFFSSKASWVTGWGVVSRWLTFFAETKPHCNDSTKCLVDRLILIVVDIFHADQQDTLVDERIGKLFVLPSTLRGKDGKAFSFSSECKTCSIIFVSSQESHPPF